MNGTRDRIRAWCVLTMLVILWCAGFAPASPTTITLSQVIYDPVANTTKYIYTVTSGAKPSLSHWEMAWCAVADIADLPQSEKPELNPGHHASCLDGYPILKFDAGYEDDEMRQVWILLNGDYRKTTTIIATTKAGNNDPVCFEVEGPDCTPPPPAHPAIDIEKLVQDEDADAPTGPVVAVGVPVIFKFVVTNTGDVPLSNIVVSDDVYGAITMPKNTLAPGESMTGTATATATAGQHANLATVTGQYEAETVRDTDPAHYWGDLKTGCIEGYVYCNGKPLADVVVRLESEKLKTAKHRTDLNGHYYFEDVILGVPCHLWVQGYPQDAFDFTLDENLPGCLEHNFYLGGCRPVLAWYEGWYSGSDDNYRYWSEQNNGGIADTSAFAFYSSHDPDIWEYHILSAWAADVDAFVVDWYGKDSYENVTLLGLLDAAQRLYEQYGDMGFDFRIIAGWSRKNSGDQTANLEYLRDVILKKQAYWGVRDNTEKLLFVYCTGSGASCCGFVNAARAILPDDVALIWNWETDKPERCECVDGFYVRAQLANQEWDPQGKKWGAEYLDNFYTVAGNAGRQYLVGGAWPGMDERNWVLGLDRYIDRQDTLVYEWTWQKAFSYQPEYLMVESWNSFDQGTHIEDAQETGHKFLQMTRNKCVLWKSECARMIADEGLCVPANLFMALKRGLDQKYIDQALYLFFQRNYGAALAILHIEVPTVTAPETRNAGLVLVAGSETAKEEGWDNAVDGDLEGWDGTTTARGFDLGGTCAIFEFADQGLYVFNHVRVQTDNGTADDGPLSSRQANDIEVLVSTTGYGPGDFTPVIRFRPKSGEMEFHALVHDVTARYIKIILHGPTGGNKGGWRQLVEFGICTNKNQRALPVSESVAVTAAPRMFVLQQNYPNPFNAATTMEYELPEAVSVSLILYDVQGREVERLVDEQQTPGVHRLEWNGTPHSSGIYFVRIQAGTNTAIKRLVLLK